MGQGLSCGASQENGFFTAVQFGEMEVVKCMLERNPSLLRQTTVYGRQSPLHVAAANGNIKILSMLLGLSVNADVLNRHKQTPLMLAAMHGRLSCMKKLIEAGANILKFDSLNGRTCLHHAAYYGHSDCLHALLSASQSSPVAVSWGYTRFVNIRDGRGATPLHLAARQRWPDCVHMLLVNGALVCASTGGYGCPGSTPLHLAARGGSLDCVRKLLAWGGDRFQRDAMGRIPYAVALKHKHGLCAALLNPTSAEPFVWPSPLKFISDLNKEARALLERALMDANRERERKVLEGTSYSPTSPMHTEEANSSHTWLCCICFEQVCTIEVQDCGHQMCAQCTLALCCHNKPNPMAASQNPPVCPFCRSTITHLVVAEVKNCDDTADQGKGDTELTWKRKSRKSQNSSEGSSSFKGLSGISSLGIMGGRGSSGKVAAEHQLEDDKPAFEAELS